MDSEFHLIVEAPDSKQLLQLIKLLFVRITETNSNSATIADKLSKDTNNPNIYFKCLISITIALSAVHDTIQFTKA